VGKQEERKELGRPRCKWVDNIELDIGGNGWGGMNWVDLSQDKDNWKALVNTLINIGGISRSAQPHKAR
jgi:hypothetical protein